MAFRDVKFALRLLKKNPGFAAVGVLALGLGTGANTAIFTAVDSILIRPLPFGEPERLVAIWEDASFVGFARNTPAPANYFDWKAQNTVFEGVAASRFRRLILRGDGTPEDIRGRATTPDLFEVLKARPSIGRVFTAEEDKQNAKVVVIGYGLWVRRFGGEASAVGKIVELNGEPFQIVGVMPRGFYYPSREVEAWVPANLEAIRTQRGSHFLQVIGRMKPGVSVEQARAEMKTIAARLAMQYPDSNSKLGSVVEALHVDMTGSTRVALFALLGAAGCVLLIACANLANLLLARAAGRSREIAVRLAVGADRKSLVVQLLTESMLLALLGGIVGIAFAALGIKGLQQMLPLGLSAPLTLDIRAFLFAFSAAALSGVLFGLVPAWQSAKVDLQSALRQTGRTGSSRTQALFRDALVAGEFALAFVLLTGAGLMIQTLVKLSSQDLGFQADRILTARIALVRTKYSNDELVRAFYREATEKLRAIPGVQSVAFASNLPYQTIGNTNGYEIEGRASERDWDALYREVSPNYFEMMGARLIAGRLFDATDRADAPRAVIINETFQKLHWPAGNAVGARIRWGSHSPWMTIIGVVHDLRERGSELAMKPAAYPSTGQTPQTSANNLAIRTHGDPRAITAGVREAIAAIDPGIPLSQIMTMEDILDADTANRRYPMQVMTVFAGLALLLAAIGIYGVLSYAVAQRVREIGVRIALGAVPSSVARMIVGRGLVLGGAGLAVGLVGSMLLARLIQTVLYGVSPYDPLTLLASGTVLTLVTIAASYIPAWRASRVDPLTALRDD